MSRIFLRDHELLSSGWCEKLETVFVEVDSSGDVCRPGADIVFRASSFDLVFLHTQDHEEEWIKQVKQDRIKAHLIFVRSQGGDSGYQGDCPRIHQCIWSPDQFVYRPESQQFVSRITEGLPPSWELLDRVHFPASLVACCWLLAAGELLRDHEKLLSALWPAARDEACRLMPSAAPLPDSFDFKTGLADRHNAIRKLLDATWQTWAPYSDTLVIRRRLSHDWCDKRAMHSEPYKVAGAYLVDLLMLTDSMKDGFRPSQYANLLQSCLISVSEPDSDELCNRIDQIVEERYAFCSIRSDMLCYMEKLKSLLTTDQPDYDQFIQLTDALCDCLSRLPKGVPLP